MDTLSDWQAMLLEHARRLNAERAKDACELCGAEKVPLQVEDREGWLVCGGCLAECMGKVVASKDYGRNER